MISYTNQEILKELKRVFRQNGNAPFTRRAYQTMGNISKTTVENRFETWTGALEKAGLLAKFERAKSRAQGKSRKAKVRS